MANNDDDKVVEDWLIAISRVQFVYSVTLGVSLGLLIVLVFFK